MEICVRDSAEPMIEPIRTKFTVNFQNSTFQASDDFKLDDSKTFLSQDIAKRFPDS